MKRLIKILKRLFKRPQPEIEPRRPGFMVHHVQTGERAWLKYSRKKSQQDIGRKAGRKHG